MLSVAALALLATATAAVPESACPEIPNLHRVDERLWRGGQPRAGGMERLRSLGIRTVVNLRYERKLIDAEREEAVAAGLTYVNIPMYGLLRPKKEQIERILALIDDSERAPVFVHCAAGRDRTGVVVACYRVARQHWSAERAIREALSYGMLTIEWAKRAFVRHYAASLQEADDDVPGAVAASTAAAAP